MLLKLFPENTKIDFISKRYIALVFSAVVILGTFFLLATRGLNFGIDFTGGILIDAHFEQPVDLAKMRPIMKSANINDVSLQSFGKENEILIRIGQTSDVESERAAIVATVKKVLADNFEGEIDYRKVDYVGPKVGGELIKSGALALLLSLVAIMVYVWARFEWQYGVGVLLALVHDAFATIGFLSLTGLEFNLSSVAAILTIIGYSVNDSVVIFDRIRENVRKFKKMPLEELLNVSINDTMSRTVMTGLTTLVAIFALVLVGGEVVRSFSLSALVGIAVGTYSSVYISAPVLMYLRLRRDVPAQPAKN